MMRPRRKKTDARTPAEGRRVSRRALLEGGVGLMATALIGSGEVDAVGAEPLQATLRFNWTIKGEFAPFFVAREKGFYEEQGVSLGLLEGKSGTQAVQVIGAGRDTFGYVPSVQVIEAVTEGIPIRTVAVLGRWTGMCWASWPDIPLRHPRDLEGHRVSISPSSTFFQVWPAFARTFHIDTSKVEVIHADPSARVGLFLSHKVDIMADIFWANDYVILRERVGGPLNVLRLADVGFDPLGYLLIANSAAVERNPDLVRRVVRATLKGFQFTIDHPSEAVEIMTRLYGDRLGARIIQGQVHNMLQLINRTPALGRATIDAWERSLTLLYSSGVIRKKLPPREYYTDAFVS